MSLRIGRVGEGIALTDISQWDENGTQTRVRFSVRRIGMQRAAELRAQLLGYVNSDDESFVPVTNEDDPSVDGYYRVLAVSITPHRVAGYLGYFLFEVTLERVTGFAAPLIELHSLGATRTDAPDDPYPVIVVPGGARSVAFFNEGIYDWVGSAPTIVRDCAVGSVKVYARQEKLAQYYVAPDKFYEGAATLLMGDDLTPVVGRQVRNTPDRWRLSSGLYELEPVAGDLFEWRHRMWLDGDWTPWVPFLWYTSPGPDPRTPMIAPDSVTVLRNSPTEVAIRLLTSFANAQGVTVDVSLKRGARSVGVVLQSATAGLFALQSAGLTWNLDEGWYVWDDADGVRHFIAAVTDVSTLGGGGVIPYEDSVSQVKNWTFTLGAADPDADVGADHILKIISAWFWAGSEQQSVVVQ